MTTKIAFTAYDSPDAIEVDLGIDVFDRSGDHLDLLWIDTVDGDEDLLPVGPPGPAGKPGAQGAPGPQGPPGPITPCPSCGWPLRVVGGQALRKPPHFSEDAALVEKTRPRKRPAGPNYK